MKLKDKYTPSHKKEAGKIEISDDAYALLEAVMGLMNSIDKARRASL